MRCLTCSLLLLLNASCLADKLPWTKSAIVRTGSEEAISFRAAWIDNTVLVEAKHAEGWHSYAMDNERRALKALAGKQSLGIEQGIEIRVAEFDIAGNWRQTKPKDLSKPELRWYTYGFEDKSYFAASATRSNSQKASLLIRGQACSGERCIPIRVDIEIVQQVSDHDTREAMQNIVKSLIPVAKTESPKSQLAEPKSDQGDGK